MVLYTHCSLARKKIMALIVSKFGGTSVASPERIKNVAKRLIAMKQQGNDVVAVVSAMGKTTDELVGLAAALNDHPSKREMDMLLSTGEQVSMSLLAMAIQALGYNSVSFTGWQAGITTDNDFSSAKIEGIDADKIRKALSTGAIVVVAGFQGVSENGDITTLGRGGSDTTAVALAYGINADVCEIYSDVEGIYTADPRVAPRARKLSCISYDDMLELSSGGAGVLQARAVEFARKYKVVIHSRSAFSDEEGTLIKEVVPSMEQAVISELNKLSQEYLDKDELEQNVEFHSNVKEKKTSLETQLITYQKKIEEDAKVIRELYLDKVKGILSENDFLNLSKDFTNDRERLEKLVIETQKQLDVIERKIQTGDNRRQLIEQYTNLEHLDRETVETLIDYILVGKRIPGTRNVPIEIHWNF